MADSPIGMHIDDIQPSQPDNAQPDQQSPIGMHIDDIPATPDQQAAPAQQQAAPSPIGMHIDDIPAEGIKPEGPGGTFFREAANAAIPTAASIAPMMAGGEIGASLGAPLGPIGAGAGALIGAGVAGIAASGVVSAVQEKVKDVLGLSDTEQRAANAQANPTSALVGQLAPMAVAFKVGDITDQIASRLLTGGGMAGVDIAQQYEQKGTVDPTEVAIQGAAGFALNKPRGFVEPYAAAGARAGAAMVGKEPTLFPPGRPDMDNSTKDADLAAVASNNTTTSDSLGNAQEKAPPRPIADDTTIGTPVAENNPYVDGDGSSTGRFAKENPAQTGEDTIHIGSQPTDDPTTMAAIHGEEMGTPDQVMAGHNEPGEVSPPQPDNGPTETGLAEGVIPNSARPAQFTPTETTPPDVIARAKAEGLPPKAADAIATSKAAEQPALPAAPKKSFAEMADEFRKQIPPKPAQPKEVVQKTLDLLRANGKNAMADRLEKMPDGSPKDMMAARLHAAEVSQTGNVPKETLANVRVRNPEHLKNLEVPGFVRPETGKVARTKTPTLAKLYGKVHDVNAKVFNDPDLQPPATPETTADQVRTRAKAILDKARDLMGANGKLPIEVYAMNAMRKPREWSLIREARNLLNGETGKRLNKAGDATPDWQKFLADEKLHRSPEGYADFERQNQSEAALAKGKAPTVEQAETKAAAAPAETRTPVAPTSAEPVEETLTERALREQKEDRVLDKLRSQKHDAIADRLEAMPLGPARDNNFKMLEAKLLKTKPATEAAVATSQAKAPIVVKKRSFKTPKQPPETQAMARPRKPITMKETDDLIKRITARSAEIDQQVKAARGETVAPTPAAPKAAAAVITSRAAEAQKGLLRRLQDLIGGTPGAKYMKGIIRTAGGIKARTLAQATKILEGFAPEVNKLGEDAKVNFMKSMDTEGTVTGPLKRLADWFNQAAADVRSKVNALPKHLQQEWVKTYFPHMFTDQAAANKFLDNWNLEKGTPNEGSGASLKQRTFPTIQEGLDAGLKLATTNPLEVMGRYLTSMHTYIANQQILQAGKDAGLIATFPTPGVGASGNIAGKKIPAGWVQLKGRAGFGEPMYAQADAAHIYNNYISKGYGEINPRFGKIAEVAQRASNALTGLELSFNGYHLFTIGKEGMINQAALAMSHAASGEFGKAIQKIGSIFTAPVSLAKTGAQVAKVYMGDAEGSPLMKQVVDLVERAGGRMVGASHDPTYQYSPQKSYFTAWRKGSLGMELAAVPGRIKNAGNIGEQGLQAGKEVFGQIGRTMQTVAEPLFQHYIPAMKNGAIYENLGGWLDAHPMASDSEQLEAARNIVDSVDNRFGEMVHDNIFWNKATKQSAMIMMRAYSWFVGTAREIGGGAASAFQNPERISISHPQHDPRAAYAVTMPIIVALTSAAYQYLKDGSNPGDLRDLFVPKTGGTVGGQPERAALPGYEKDVYGWAHDPQQEGINKLATAPRLLWETLANKDYKGQVIANGNDPIGKRLEAYAGHVLAAMNPISVKNVARKTPVGSNITLPERVTAIRQAPSYMTNPQAVHAAIYKKNQKDYRMAQHSAIKAANKGQ